MTISTKLYIWRKLYHTQSSIYSFARKHLISPYAYKNKNLQIPSAITQFQKDIKR